MCQAPGRDAARGESWGRRGGEVGEDRAMEGGTNIERKHRLGKGGRRKSERVTETNGVNYDEEIDEERDKGMGHVSTLRGWERMSHGREEQARVKVRRGREKKDQSQDT